MWQCDCEGGGPRGRTWAWKLGCISCTTDRGPSVASIMCKIQMAGKKTAMKQKVVVAPVAKRTPTQQRNPGSVVITERERIASVNGSSSFALALTHTLNPGLIASFPWLSNIANQYDKYRVHKAIYRFKTARGTSSAGNVLMGFDKDPTDSPPGTAMEMTQHAAYVDGPVWDALVINAQVDKEARFVRSAAVASSDIRISDAGRLFVGTEGCADNSLIGYIEAEYTFEFFQKTSGASGGKSTNRSISEYSWSTAFNGVQGPITEISNGAGLIKGATSVTLTPASYLLTVMLNDLTIAFGVYLDSTAVYFFNDFGAAPTEYGRTFSKVVTVTTNQVLTIYQTGAGATSGTFRLELL